MPFRSGVSFSQPSRCPQHKPLWPLKPSVLGLVLLVQESQAGEPDVGIRPPTSWAELLQFSYSPVCMLSRSVVSDSLCLRGL